MGTFREEWTSVNKKRLTGRERDGLFARLCRHGFAGVDVPAEIAPEGWEQSPLLACFHRASSSFSRNEWRSTATWKNGVVSEAGARTRRRSNGGPNRRSKTCSWMTNQTAANVEDEVTELVGLSMGIFSDNHDVIAADGRVADVGSFRGAGAPLTRTSRVTRRAG
jgi:hypothetical protein